MIPPIHAKRCQFYFSDQRMEWSEVYWQSEAVALDNALTRAILLGAKRVKTLGKGVQLVEIRASDDAVFRDSNVYTGFQNWASPPGSAPGLKLYNLQLLGDCDDDGIAAAPTRCLRLRQEGQASGGAPFLHRRVVYFSGMPDCDVSDQGNVPPFPGVRWGQAFNDWAAQVVDPLQAWGFVGFKTPALLNGNILNIVRQVDNVTVIITYGGADVFPVGSTVEVFRPIFFGGSLKIQGKYEVIQSGPNQISIRDNRPGAVGYDRGGTLRSVTQEWCQITQVITDGWQIHKRGAAELAPRGRLRSRKAYAG